MMNVRRSQEYSNRNHNKQHQQDTGTRINMITNPTRVEDRAATIMNANKKYKEQEQK
jgi:hypothetical protein